MSTRPTSILVTGGAGFIGGWFIREWLRQAGGDVVNVDKLTYAADPESVRTLSHNARYDFVQGDVADEPLIYEILADRRPSAIVHFAAESHVDRSITGPSEFVRTNVFGTYSLLEASRRFWISLSQDERDQFRFVHVSTDEVYGVAAADTQFTEISRYQPNSPYAASKAASDHFVRAYHRTYGLPTLVTHASNNYGPYQFPEKLIPLTIRKLSVGEQVPVYGDGQQIRDWLFVTDHCRALRAVLRKGIPGEAYNIGGDCEQSNLSMVQAICDELERITPHQGDPPYRMRIAHVTDRPGHDRRYSVDSSRIKRELGWQPRVHLQEGLRRTVAWYVEHADWIDRVASTMRSDNSLLQLTR